MQALFNTLVHGVEGAPGIAMAAAFAWGILSVLLSPCHLASIPLIIGYIDTQGHVSTWRAFRLSVLFALGILITIALVGVITAAAGRMLGDVGRYGNYFLAGLLFLVGLNLMDVVPIPWQKYGRTHAGHKGFLGAFVLGLVFGVALGPCTFAYMAPMLAVALKQATTNPLGGVLLLVAYGAGHCLVIVVAGTSIDFVQRFLRWSEDSSGTVTVRRICGVLVLLGGIWMIYTAP